MQIVIDIPDRIHFGIEKGFCANGSDASQIVLDAVKNGKPLSKGHGRLFDERDIVNGNYEVIGNRIYELEPIIEADKESE